MTDLSVPDNNNSLDRISQVLGSRGRGFDVDVSDEVNHVGSDDEEGSCPLPDGADNVAYHSRLHVSMAKKRKHFRFAW